MRDNWEFELHGKLLSLLLPQTETTPHYQCSKTAMQPRFVILSVLITWSTWGLAASARAHEYWLEPVKFQIRPGGEIAGNLKNGQNFKGTNFAYIASRFDRFTINTPSGSTPVAGRDGDRPALIATADKAGLYSVSYQGKFERITFTDPAKMQLYEDYEGLTGLLQQHVQRGLARDRLQEHYARCAKALVQVGKAGPDDAGDHLTGLVFELVAEENPYMLDEKDTLPVRLYWQGEPAGNIQIRWFRHRNATQTGTVRTDESGRARIPLSGGGKFLLNAVKIYPGDENPETDIPEWYSYWSSLTFGIKGTDAALDEGD